MRQVSPFVTSRPLKRFGVLHGPNCFLLQGGQINLSTLLIKPNNYFLSDDVKSHENQISCGQRRHLGSAILYFSLSTKPQKKPFWFKKVQKRIGGVKT